MPPGDRGSDSSHQLIAAPERRRLGAASYLVLHVEPRPQSREVEPQPNEGIAYGDWLSLVDHRGGTRRDACPIGVRVDRG